MLINVPGLVEDFLVWFVTKVAGVLIELIHSWFETASPW